jgi:hypothetical protein
MSIEAFLRAALTSDHETRTPGHAAQTWTDFDRAYRARINSPSQREALDDAADAAMLGPAAYSLGVHLLLHGFPDRAEPWLRIAAANDIGDAAFRLARLHEHAAVDTFNHHLATGLASAADVSDAFREAARWYADAASRGYGPANHPRHRGLDMPALGLDCCDLTRATDAVEAARTELASLRADTDRARREARRDVATIVDTARSEVADLARMRQQLAEQIGEFEQAINTLSRITNHPRLSSIRLVTMVVWDRLRRLTRRPTARHLLLALATEASTTLTALTTDGHETATRLRGLEQALQAGMPALVDPQRSDHVVARRRVRQRTRATLITAGPTARDPR